MSDPTTSTECPGTYCNDEPITICTSLPATMAPTAYDEQCRELAELMCLAIVRSVEEINRQHRGTSGASLSSTLLAWKSWAKGAVTGKPGLPDCLDPSDPTDRTLGSSMRPEVSSSAPAGEKDAAQYTNAAFEAIQQLGAGFASFDIDDWYDD